MFLMIDNYDSFVYNLVRYFEELNEKVIVYRNDKISIKDIKKMDLQGIIISPGPKNPNESGICIEIVREFYNQLPILGICLGHQTIAFAFGGEIIRGTEPVHGKISSIVHNGMGVFKDIRNPLNVTRYHSLIVDEDTLPEKFIVTCRSNEGVIMGIRHKHFLVEGVQFHPEAELTECGHQMLKNFLNEAREYRRMR